MKKCLDHKAYVERADVISCKTCCPIYLLIYSCK